MKNFYVDDLLKSVKTEKYAVDLIKRVKEMCAAGGFNLTKFICNRKNVLMSIPDIHRREGVKDADLVKEDLPTERALRVYWNVEKDALCFKVNLKEKPRNRRGFYVEFLLRSSGFSFTIHPKGKANSARTLPKRIILGETNISMGRNGNLGKENYMT